MRARATGSKWLILCSILAVGAISASPQAAARSKHHASVHRVHATRSYAHRYSISCVPFARGDSGIQVAGNAWQWWDNAAGIYARGHVPEVGSVLNFEANRRMRLGHVAVVSRVISRREIEVDQANWPRGGISRGVPVIDVSEDNNWTAVRVGIGSDSFGSIYPTYGFIYDRRDNGVLLTASHMPAPRPILNAAPADLRNVSADTELAEAPAPRHGYHHRTRSHSRAVHHVSGHRLRRS